MFDKSNILLVLKPDFKGTLKPLLQSHGTLSHSVRTDVLKLLNCEKPRLPGEVLDETLCGEKRVSMTMERQHKEVPW